AQLALAQRAHLLALSLRRALAGLQVPAGLEAVEDVDERALGVALERGAGERVVHPVGHEHGPDAEALVAADAPVDVTLRALRLRALQAAAEQVGGLDPDEHRELAARDHPACLRGVVDEPEPALPDAAALGIHVALQLLQSDDLAL